MQTSLLLCENELDFLDVGAGILGETNPSHQQWDEKILIEIWAFLKWYFYLVRNVSANKYVHLLNFNFISFVFY